ncbi:MAG TPA: hypothetical protein VHA52_05145, partial [Candidatus Babeliaceae bacterium]|nr:hypothetical protein [Candidatus Babeliaceae bacterium]
MKLAKILLAASMACLLLGPTLFGQNNPNNTKEDNAAMEKTEQGWLNWAKLGLNSTLSKLESQWQTLT